MRFVPSDGFLYYERPRANQGRRKPKSITAGATIMSQWFFSMRQPDHETPRFVRTKQLTEDERSALTDALNPFAPRIKVDLKMPTGTIEFVDRNGNVQARLINVGMPK